MTIATIDSWLIVKWIGIAVAVGYLALLVVVFVRFRRSSSPLRPAVVLPAVVGSFIGSAGDIFGYVSVMRACFVAASVIYLYGLAILVKGLTWEGPKGLFKEGGAEDYVQSLKLN